MADIVTVIILLLCVGSAFYCIYKNRKKGKSCIGCPQADSCGKECSKIEESIEFMEKAVKRN